jgi:hypothetical protein
MFAIGAFESPDGRGPEGRGVGVTVMTAVAADFFKAIAPAKKLLKATFDERTRSHEPSDLTRRALSLEGMSREQSRSSASTRLSPGTPNRQN